jgi:hypothetical protein
VISLFIAVLGGLIGIPLPIVVLVVLWLYLGRVERKVAKIDMQNSRAQR